MLSQQYVSVIVKSAMVLRSLHLFLFLLLGLADSLLAQPWAGILSPSRAADWSTAGVLGGIPNRTKICATLGTAGLSPTSTQSVTASQINSALSNCSEGVVYLNPGTYNLTAGIDFGGGTAGVTLRGAGADQTLLVFSGDAGCNGARASVCMHSSDTNWKGGPSNTANWTAGYARGTTTITLSSVSNLRVGNPLILDQLDDTNDDGSIVVTASTSAGTKSGTGIGGPYSLEDNGGGNQRSGRQQQQIVTVTACGSVTTTGASCSGSNVTVTISPGLYMPTWSSSKSPQAWWPTDPSLRVGVEDLSIDSSKNSSSDAGIELFNCSNCWVKGVRSMNSGRAHVQAQSSPRFTIRDSYFFLTQNSVSQSYGFECYGGADGLVENNIFHAVAAPEMINGNCSGTVVGYNFSINNYYTGSSRYNISANNQHAAGIDFLLFEGNYGNSIYGDLFHGTHHFVTYFRNRWTGPQPACWSSGSPYTSATFASCTNNLSPVVLQSFSRFFNLVGNVLGTSGVNTSYSSGVYDLGSGNANSSVSVKSDPNVATTLMRWGNYDSATAKVNFTTSEVPSSLSGAQASYSNPVPSSTTLPASFYYTSKPSWWPAAKAWPPIGPGVTGGNLTGVGGYAYSIPAHDCFLNVMGGAADGTGAVRSFNASSCYTTGSGGGSTPTPPAAPASLTVVTQ
jgi:hypothetical protein